MPTSPPPAAVTPTVALHARVRDQVVARLDPGGSEGSLWLGLTDRRGRLALCTDVGVSLGVPDELFVRDLAALVRTFDPPTVVLAVCRAGGRPTRVDRRLGRELAARLAQTGPTTVDLMVVVP